MLSINACDIDLIAVMGNTVNDCISQRACFSPKLIVPFIEYILRTENKFTLPHCRVFLSSLHCFPLARKKRDTGQLSLQIKVNAPYQVPYKLKAASAALLYCFFGFLTTSGNFSDHGSRSSKNDRSLSSMCLGISVRRCSKYSYGFRLFAFAVSAML